MRADAQTFPKTGLQSAGRERERRCAGPHPQRQREAFDTLLFVRWRPHSALGYRPPAPEAWQPRAFAWRAPQQTQGAGLLEGKILT